MRDLTFVCIDFILDRILGSRGRVTNACMHSQNATKCAGNVFVSGAM